MADRPRGGDDRPLWILAGVATLVLAVVAAAIIAVASSRRPGGAATPSGPGSALAGPAAPTASPSASSPVTSSLPAGSATGSPGPGPGTVPPPSPLSGPDDAGPAMVPLSDANGPIDVARLLFGSGGASCGSANNSYLADCAVTRRLGRRLQQLYGAGQPYEPLCRCQQAWNQVTYSLTQAGPNGGDGNHGAVSVGFVSNSNGKRGQVTVLVERTVDGWLANDTWCAAAAAQDIYVPQPPGCSGP